MIGAHLPPVEVGLASASAFAGPAAAPANNPNPAGLAEWERAADDISCTDAAFEHKLEVAFGRGALLAGRTRVLSASLNGNTVRGVDLPEKATADPADVTAPVCAAATDHAAKLQK